MDQELGDFLAEIDKADTLDLAWAATVSYLKRLGIEHIHYVYAPARHPTDVVLRQTTSPEWWLEQYASCGFGAFDPGQEHCRRSRDILLIGTDFAPRDADPGQLVFLQELRSLGVSSGFVVPLRLDGERRFGAFSCQTRFSRREIERWLIDLGNTLQLALFYADGKYLDLVRKINTEKIKLSVRERECLLWLAEGLRNDRIAQRMGVSNPTVEMHLAHARHKLRAATREQALAKAISLGLIVP